MYNNKKEFNLDKCRTLNTEYLGNFATDEKEIIYEWIRHIRKLGVCASKTHKTYKQQTEFHKRLNNILQTKPNYSSYSSGII